MQAKFEKHTDIVFETVTEQKRKLTSSLNPSPEVGVEFAEFDGWESTQDYIYGFANGVVDVFPFQSLPDRCRGNVTQIY